MSLYAQAVKSGVSAGQLLLTGENAATKAAYNASYQVAAKKINLAAAKHKAQLNITAIEQDRILSNTHIRLQQDQAEANAIVSAAVAGIEGQSVNDVVYDTEKNAALASNSVNQRADSAKESQLAQIGSSQSALLAVDEPSIDYAGNLLAAFSSFDMSDFKIHEALTAGTTKE